VIERQIEELSNAERYRTRQVKSLPQLDALKTWLETNVHKVLKSSLTRRAMEYTPTSSGPGWLGAATGAICRSAICRLRMPSARSQLAVIIRTQ
jgi:hypothetical protein